MQASDIHQIDARKSRGRLVKRLAAHDGDAVHDAAVWQAAEGRERLHKIMLGTQAGQQLLVGR